MSESSARLVAIVREVLPNAMYRVEIPGNRLLSAHVGGAARGTLSRLVPGDAVQVEISPYDRGACRITGRAPGTRGR